MAERPGSDEQSSEADEVVPDESSAEDESTDDAGDGGDGGAPSSGAGQVVRWLETVDNGIGHVEHTLLFFFLFSLIGVGVLGAIGGNLFGYNPAWTFDAIRYSVFFIAMTGAALTAQTGKLISMDIVSRLVTPQSRTYLRFVTAVFTVVMCWYLMRAAPMLRDAINKEPQNYELIPPASAVYALDVGAGLVAFHVALHTLVDAINLFALGIVRKEEQPSGH